MLLGWVTNNYWETNFRAYQPGRVAARYRILPHDGAFDEAQAHRFGLEALYSQPVTQHLHEPAASNPPLPTRGTLLELPELPVIALHIKRSEDGKGVIVRLLNTSDRPQTAAVGSGLLRINKAGRCDLLGQVGDALPVSGGRVSIDIPARRVSVVYLELA
jgi:alpha-mannosidase